MNWGGPEFVLGIIAIGTVAGAIKYWIRASTGVLENDHRPHGRRRRQLEEQQNEVLSLRQENARLVDRLEASEDRLAILERIVTDRGYRLADEIEALRNTKIN